MADNISTGILSGLYEKVYNPDVLSCLANLSSDEVFTPPEIVNKMLDMLPQELFSSPDTKFLDPAVKTGVFLREIAKRLIKGLEAVIPDRQQRIDHIFKNQLYGIAITELTSLLSRRSLYCSKYANSAFSVTHFEIRTEISVSSVSPTRSTSPADVFSAVRPKRSTTVAKNVNIMRMNGYIHYTPRRFLA